MKTSPETQRSVFHVRGLDCAEEIRALRNALDGAPGVAALHFDLLNARMTVEHQGDTISPERIATLVSQTGMTAVPWSPSGGSGSEESWWARNGRVAATAASGVALLAGFGTQALHGGIASTFHGAEGASPTRPVQALYALAIAAGALYVLPKAMHALRRLQPDMNLLMVIAVAGAVVLGEWLEGATVAFLFALSLLLESWSVGRARRAVKALLDLAPPKARIIEEITGSGAHSCGCSHGCGSKSPAAPEPSDRNPREELLEVAAVAVGTRVLVKPGEKIPLDGEVLEGESHANEAPITGESMPVPKRPGDRVFAGSINGDGALTVRTTKPASDTTLARIIRLVGEAQTKRAPSERWVERFARIYTPAVMALAAAVAIVPPLFGGDWSKWFYEALTLLVIACPCALVISTPVSIVAALASGARHGVLIKGGLHVETPSRIRAVAFDKTGTITEGRPAVRRVLPFSGHSEEEVLRIAAAIEARSEHPLARAIVEHAALGGLHPRPADNFQALKGRGATATIDGRAVWIGSPRYLEECGLRTATLDVQLAELSREGATVVAVGEADRVLGLLALSDSVRPQAPAMVSALRAAGIERVVLLTGDAPAIAESIAKQAGIDEAHGALLPEDKVAAIEALKQRYGAVAMIGDGVNDAPALAAADLGIAMGAAGTDAAIETADIALMKDDLSRLPWLLRHSRRTLSIIRFNIGLSIGVKAAFAALALFGASSLWGAIAADTGVSLLVVANALRLLADSE